MGLGLALFHVCISVPGTISCVAIIFVGGGKEEVREEKRRGREERGKCEGNSLLG